MNIKSFFTKKRAIYGAVILVILLGGYFLFFNKKTKQETLVAHAGDFLQQISVSGKVVATENLDLSFEQAGIISRVYANVGNTVSTGALLVSQDIAQLASQLAEMQAGIDLQKAKLAQLLAGASPEDIKIKSDAVLAAKQDVKDAYDSALATLNSSYNAIYNAYTVALYMKRTYFTSTDQQSIKVQNSLAEISNNLQDARKFLDNASAGQSAIDTAITTIYTDVTTTYADLKIIRDQCDQDIYYTSVSAADKTSLDTQKTNINTALTNTASSKQNITSYKTALQLAQNQLDALQAPSRPTDIAVFEAQIKQAEASTQNVISQIRKRQIFSPINGIITQVNAKIGSIFSSGQIAVSLISAGKFQIESYVPEIYISFIKIGDDAEATLDSYGPDKVFKAKVISIDPSQTQKDGVSTYKIKLELEDAAEQLRDGMTANVIITTAKKSNTISIPQGIVTSKNGKKFVKVKNGDSVIEKEIIIGDVSSSGQVEVLSGIGEGDEVIVK